MNASRKGQIAVIFISQRTADDDAGYADAAEKMEALAAQQPGYRGIDSAKNADGFGIAVSWWADEASAVAWRKHPEHAATRERGRGVWYESYDLSVAEVGRSYAWRR